MATQTSHHPSHWLHQYGNSGAYAWRRSKDNDTDIFSRPLGLVEFSFDADGRYYEGRADMNCELELNIKTRLTEAEYRERILLAWTLLRQRHSLLQSRTFLDPTCSIAPSGIQFAVPIHNTPSKAVDSAGKHLVFLHDHYSSVDHRDFYVHCLNASRILRPAVALAKLFVLPLSREDGKGVLRFHFIFAHSISDGLSAYGWMNDWIRILNDPLETIHADIATYIDPNVLEKRLPPPQEALYPPVPGCKARQRWFWATTRILRHVRRPLPLGFDNPLRRQKLHAPVPFSPVYSKVLDYSKTPPLNTIPADIRLSASNTQRLHSICREGRASIGAGAYALAALCMMEFYEEREPQVPLEERKCFITGFPLDPRAFFGFHSNPDSMMLAFSDGIALPGVAWTALLPALSDLASIACRFLSSDLPVEGRLRLLARQAQRQLSAYQKRAKPKGEDSARHCLKSRGAGLILANQYLYSYERADSILPEDMRRGVTLQGAYAPRSNPTSQTCGVSSIGNRDLLIKGGMYDVETCSKEFAVDFQHLNATVRARDNEFLLGIAGTKEALFATPSIDMTAMDITLVERWKHRFEHALDDEYDRGGKARL